ncbi:unnamed protein product [Caenorhabditis angaria]|uniref:Apple domain-containing protein n=1 Tax=Caenorhabditis angaria TaxID=860376 RepID=A0A9P1IX85_9PELO|nr:unnamed protein product [Caenorhabditis angaria]
MIIITFQFIYRYFAICKVQNIKYFEGKCSFIWIFIGSIFIINIFLIAKLAGRSDGLLEKAFFNEFNISISNVSYFVISYYNENGAVNFNGILSVCNMFLIMTMFSGISLICAIKTYKSLNRTRETVEVLSDVLNTQLFFALIAQTCVPIIFIYTPISIILVAPTLNANGQFLQAVTGFIAIYPILDPILILLIIICYQIVLIYGTLKVSGVLSTTSLDNYDSCASSCLSNINCVSLIFTPSSGSCSIYSMYQVLSYQKNDTLETIVGIKTNSTSLICSSSFSDVDLSGDVNGIAYQFSESDSTFSYETCPDGYKQFTRTRGLWCMKLYNFQTAKIAYNNSYCSQYSAYPSGFDNANEVSYITSQMIANSMYAVDVAVDGYRSSSCFNSTTVWCDDYEYFNNYTSTPAYINWTSTSPSRWTFTYQENRLAIRMANSSIRIKIFNDIASVAWMYGFVCGVPLGNWDFE